MTRSALCEPVPRCLTPQRNRHHVIRLVGRSATQVGSRPDLLAVQADVQSGKGCSIEAAVPGRRRARAALCLEHQQYFRIGLDAGKTNRPVAHALFGVAITVFSLALGCDYPRRWWQWVRSGLDGYDLLAVVKPSPYAAVVHARSPATRWHRHQAGRRWKARARN